jgi:putative redox protein
VKSVSIRTMPGRRYAVQVDDGRHSFVMDEPAADGGDDLGPSPYEMLLAALGGCIAITLEMYAGRKQWPLREVAVDLTHDKVNAADCDECTSEEIAAASPNGRIDLIHVSIRLEGDLDDAQRARLLEIAGRCPVHRTLEAHPKIVAVIAK